jgi:hypothetical protein
MSLERNRLARIDRRLLAGLDRDESFRMVRVPVTAATWSTWKRYCDAAGISMGRAIAVLIEHELVNALGEGSHAGVAVLVDQAEEQLAARERQVAAREESVGAAEERLRGRTEGLRHHEAELQILEQRIEIASNAILRSRQTGPKVGRNERCPCGSGLKHKHCHGLAGRWRLMPDPALVFRAIFGLAGARYAL